MTKTLRYCLVLLGNIVTLNSRFRTLYYSIWRDPACRCRRRAQRLTAPTPRLPTCRLRTPDRLRRMPFAC